MCARPFACARPSGLGDLQETVECPSAPAPWSSGSPPMVARRRDPTLGARMAPCHRPFALAFAFLSLSPPPSPPSFASIFLRSSVRPVILLVIAERLLSFWYESWFLDASSARC